MEALRAEAVGDWQACGECFYARELLHDMQWEDLEVEGKRLCCANYAGPVAVIRDERQMVVVTGGSVQPLVRIFTAAGTSLGSFMWDSPARLLEWGWSSALQLMCVEPTAMVVLRSLGGEKLREMSLGAEPAAQGLVSAVLAGDSVAVLTTHMGVWALPDVMAPRPMRLAAVPIDRDMAGACRMAVLQPHQTMSGAMEVLLCAGGSVLYQLDEDTCEEHPLGLSPHSPVTLMRVSPCGAFLALLTADGRLVVMSSDLSRRLSEFETHADAPPLAVEWCGSDAVVMQWPQLLVVVGPYGDHASWSTADDKVVLVPEIDGVRLVGSARHELLRKVPTPVSEVFRPGSTAPATQLWDARALLDAGSARCDKVLRSLGQDLPQAVAACIEAAGHDLSAPRQRALLRAAAYGRVFCGPAFPAHRMATTAHALRLLNSMRDTRCGLPLTHAQLHALGIPAVLARLVLYRQWLLAYRIAGSLTWAPAQLLAPSATPRATAHISVPSLPTPSALNTPAPASSDLPPLTDSPTAGGLLSLGGPAGTGPLQGVGAEGAMATVLQEAVLAAWACARISAAAKTGGGSGGAVADAEVKEQLLAKLKECHGIRYAPLAAHAQAVGRRRLALLLLEEETSCALQVPLLLSLATGQPGGKGGARQDDVDEGGESEDALSRALRRAIESGDTDLVYHVLFHTYRARPAGEFWALISSRVLARNLFVKYCKAREPELLETMLTTTGQVTELADLKVVLALGAWSEAHSRQQAGDAALNALTTTLTFASNKYAMSREHAFQSKATAELSALRKEQARLERETGQQLLVGLSLGNTLQELIRLGHHKHAAALRKQFAVTDRHFWWLKVRALAEARAWDALDTFASEKKSPVGYEPFLEVAKRFGAPREVQARLISRLPDSAAKAEAYSAIDHAREAAEVAARLKDQDLLRRISSAVSAASPAGLAIAQIKERFLAGTGSGRS